MVLLSCFQIGAIGVWSYVYNIICAYGKRDDGDVSAYSRLRETKHGETSKRALDSTTRALLPSSNSKDDELVYQGPIDEAKVFSTLFSLYNLKVDVSSDRCCSRSTFSCTMIVRIYFFLSLMSSKDQIQTVHNSE